MWYKILLSSCMVIGTALGGGVIALPLINIEASLFQVSLVYGFCGLINFVTGLIFAELCSAGGYRDNFYSLSKRFLGVPGQIATISIFCFTFYLLLSAYLLEGSHAIQDVFDLPLLKEAVAIFLIFFVPLIYCGLKVIGSVNNFLVISMITAYFILIFFGIKDHSYGISFNGRMGPLFTALPIIFSAFGYHLIIPTILRYLNGDICKFRLSLFIGMATLVAIYALWFTIFKLNFTDADMLYLKETSSEPVDIFTVLFRQSSILNISVKVFSFSAVATSFIGVSIGLQEFFMDLFPGIPMKKAISFIVVFVPVVMITLGDANTFLRLISLGGGLGALFVTTLLPIVMSFRGKFFLKNIKREVFPGGLWGFLLLSTLSIFATILVALQIYVLV